MDDELQSLLDHGFKFAKNTEQTFGIPPGIDAECVERATIFHESGMLAVWCEHSHVGAVWIPQLRKWRTVHVADGAEFYAYALILPGLIAQGSTAVSRWLAELGALAAAPTTTRH